MKLKIGRILWKGYYGEEGFKKCIIVILSVLIFSSCNQSYSDDIVELYEENTQIMESVAEFMLKSEYKDIYIHLSSWDGNTMFTGLQDKDVKIENSRVIEEIHALHNEDCEIITKEESSVYFQYKSNRYIGYGIVYSPNGDFKNNENIERIYSVNDKGWYYYEEH